MSDYKIIKTVYFTDKGKETAGKIFTEDSNFIPEYKSENVTLQEWVDIGFREHMPLLFIGSVGIAVRAIAHCVTNKLSDSAVIVVDELGKNVIPILSGHFGGANDLALSLAKMLDAKPVITTATDINEAFSVDVFAKNNGFKIVNKNGIKDISSRILKGEELSIKIDVAAQFNGDLPKELCLTSNAADIIISDYPCDGFSLIPKRLVLGIGCKKNKSFKDILDVILKYYDEDYLRANLYAISSIDIKEKELGLVKLAQFFGVPFLTFNAKSLSELQGDFASSEFVNETVGVSNVCERAAVLGAGLKERKLELEKIAGEGVTIACAKRQAINIVWKMRR